MLIRQATTLGGTVVDIRVEESILAVSVGLRSLPGEQIMNVDGALVIPGLHDHHIHLYSAAARAASLSVAAPAVTDRASLAQALAAARPGSDGWIRAVDHHEGIVGPLTREDLDRLCPTTPLRLEHRSGGLWILNSAGLSRLGLDRHETGRLRRDEAERLRDLPRERPSLRSLATELASYGVVGVTDATPNKSADDVSALARAHLSGELPQRVHCMAPPEIEPVPGVTLGPVKFLLEDDRLDLDALTRAIERSHVSGRSVAIHAVTVPQLVVAMSALQTAGLHPHDRLEHAAMVPDDCLDSLRDFAVTVVTQPNFIAERGDQYRHDIPADELPQLWRVAGLERAGVPVALSTDAPYGNPDPWATMRAAVDRSTADGHVLGVGERIDRRHALELFLGHADDPTRLRAVAVGDPGDLCVVTGCVNEILEQLNSNLVSTTIVGGKVVWEY